MKIKIQVSQLTVDSSVYIIDPDDDSHQTGVSVDLEDLSDDEFDELMIEHLNHYYASVERKCPFNLNG